MLMLPDLEVERYRLLSRGQIVEESIHRLMRLAVIAATKAVVAVAVCVAVGDDDVAAVPLPYAQPLPCRVGRGRGIKEGCIRDESE